MAFIPKAAQRAVTMRMRAAGGSPGFFRQPSGEVSPRNRSLAMDLAADMMVQVECRTGHEAILSDLMIAVIEAKLLCPGEAFPCRSGRRTFQRRIREFGAPPKLAALRPAAISILAVSRRRPACRHLIFFACFNSSIGIPLKVYLNAVGMERAVYAALRDNFHGGEIGERRGFAEPAHFTRFFRNHAGVCPREFRELCRARPVDAAALHRTSNETDW